MADRNRRFSLAAIALPLFFVMMSGLGRAATITVTNTHDTGSGSLRDAITTANSAPTTAYTINFNVSGTITLGSSLPTIANTSPGSLTIDGSGHAITLDGASLYTIFFVNSGATLSLNLMTLTDGFVSMGFGGGIYNQGTLNVSNSTFSDNSASKGFGGAIFNQGTLNVTNSTFSGNSAPQGFGGAISSQGTLTITNSTFSGNLALLGFGGAIESIETLYVTNSTFSGNQASVSGGIYNEGTANLKGTILASSTGDNCGGTAVTDVGHNISDDDTCGFSGTSVNDSTTLHLDPAGLQNNGGPTKTIAIDSESQAFHFIPVADCTDQSSPTPLPLTTDQRGFPRPDPGNPDFCDAGAFELQTTPIVISAIGERLQIVHSSTPAGNQLNTSFTFTESGFPTCDAGDDPFNGIDVTIKPGNCAVNGPDSIEFFLDSWAVQTVNHQTYGTLSSIEPPETLSARMVALPTPVAPACGEWTINLEFAGVDLTPFGDGPFALIVTNPDGDTGCFDVTNAIVGNQIDPPTRTVRRGVRR